MKRSDVDPIHPGTLGGGDAQVAVLPDDTVTGADGQPSGSLEERIGIGLVTDGVLACHHGVEGAIEPDMGEDPLADGTVAAGDHRDRNPAPAATDNIDHRVDRLDMGQTREEGLLFGMHRSVEIDLDARLARERGHDVARRPPPHRIEAVFVELQAMDPRDMEPGQIMGRHRVGEGAIAVEEDGVVVLEGPDGHGGHGAKGA